MSASGRKPSGLQTGTTKSNVAETMGQLEGALNANPALTIIAEIDHQASAAKADLELRPTRVTIFGNPALGTPLMQINPLAGLDLPQKMVAWTDESNQSHIAYNSADYLCARYDLGGAQTVIDKVNAAQAKLASVAAGQDLAPGDVSLPAAGEGIVIVDSANDFDTTYNTLRASIDAAPPLTIVAVLDHSANAAKVDLTLGPTKLIIFGNPALGTPLMQSAQTIGIDLPQVMLVFESADGRVSVAYNDPAYLAQRHGITDRSAMIEKMTAALNGLATSAASG